jgi:glutamine cyclotransferase
LKAKFLALILFFTSCSNSINLYPFLEYEIVKIYNRNSDNFTQGLIFNNNYIYESTGLYGNSYLKKISLPNYKEEKIFKLEKRFFGEGITLVDDKIYQLTWNENTCFVYDKENFNLIKSFFYEGQGWGITYDGEYIIMSDGSNKLYFRDKTSFEIKKIINVTYNNLPVNNINELEFIKKYIFANIWYEDKIAVINKDNGKVIYWIDFKDISKNFKDREGNVLNGIAFNQEKDTLFITGKRWNKVFEIKLKNF